MAAGAAELARRAGCAPAQPAGGLASCRWVLDPAVPAPVTGRTVGSPPADRDLTAEERAAIEAFRDTGRPPEREHALGAARVLGWILGFTPVSR
ncbi:hypothetical protein AB0D10_44515 [Kitasatospora sp. NPDC048545]|uniref:hypothetical protein n=1 Tax=Kitasatospora sp. NPDC048545 TaxID=3157208 RepID=UPI0033C231A3